MTIDPGSFVLGAVIGAGLIALLAGLAMARYLDGRR